MRTGHTQQEENPMDPILILRTNDADDELVNFPVLSDAKSFNVKHIKKDG